MLEVNTEGVSSGDNEAGQQPSSSGDLQTVGGFSAVRLKDFENNNLIKNPADKMKKTENKNENESDTFEGPEKPIIAFEEKLADDKFTKVNVVKELLGQEVDVALFQREGFTNPILVRDKKQLGLRVPALNDPYIWAALRSRSKLELTDATSQKNIQIRAEEFIKHWSTPPESRTLQLDGICLELSNTKLDPLVILIN